MSWRFVGNKIQYDFNNDLAARIKSSKIDYCKEQPGDLAEKLHTRNKLIRIADSSSGGWGTVRQYEANPIASDSEEESKIHKAEGERSNVRNPFHVVGTAVFVITVVALQGFVSGGISHHQCNSLVYSLQVGAVFLS